MDAMAAAAKLVRFVSLKPDYPLQRVLKFAWGRLRQGQKRRKRGVCYHAMLTSVTFVNASRLNIAGDGAGKNSAFSGNKRKSVPALSPHDSRSRKSTKFFCRPKVVSALIGQILWHAAAKVKKE
ncbi:hypothetical protein [Rhizobium straminoryzae]|uniref:hypothetical protein n=1 Tax=Rhizobium straminoryzae TaxID=1387186 RepID=UPI00163DAB81|nr:hypothetical protein [Rhizobium straminoryzae]